MTEPLDATHAPSGDSTMKIDDSTAKTNPITTAKPVVRMVAQISGQARRV